MLKLRLILPALLLLSYLSTFAQQPQITTANTSPSAQVTPAIADPTTQPKDQTREEKDRLLAEYQLAERVKDRVTKDFLTYGAILGLVFAVVGFIGFNVIQETISRRVMDTVKKEIDKDVETVRTRIQTALADLQISLAESKLIAERSKNQLEELKKRHTELEDLSPKYETLHQELVGITERVETALAKANESERKTEGLRDAVTQTLAGRPSILGYGFNWDNWGSIQGANFGENPGKVYLTIWGGIMRPGMVIFEKKWEMPELEISGSLINHWKDDSIDYHPPGGYKALIQHFKEKVEEAIRSTQPDRLSNMAFRFNYRVETANWAVSEDADKWNANVPPSEPLL